MSESAQPDYRHLGNAVLAWRTVRGLSQADVANRGGPSDTTQSAIETGEWKSARPNQTLRKIEVGFGWPAGTAHRVLFEEYDPLEDLADLLEDGTELRRGEEGSQFQADAQYVGECLIYLDWNGLRAVASIVRNFIELGNNGRLPAEAADLSRIVHGLPAHGGLEAPRGPVAVPTPQPVAAPSALAAYEDETDIEEEQGHDEHP